MMKYVLLLFAMYLPLETGLINIQQSQNSTSAKTAQGAEDQEWVQFEKRFAEHIGVFEGAMWGLAHSDDPKEDVKQCFELLKLATPEFSKSGGLTKFKDGFANLLNSKGDTVAGFAATMLAVAGDLRYAPKISSLMDKDGPSIEDVYPPVTARGSAARALGLLQAREFTTRIAQLLRSQNYHDRMGAAVGLGYLKATEYAKDVAGLLANEEFAYRDNSAPIYSVIMMGVGADYKREIAQVLVRESSGETKETAVYALAHLGAKEYASKMAELLKDDYRWHHAAKALAILGAREYANKIAARLKDRNSIYRYDALLLFGILQAKTYAPTIASFLKNKDLPMRNNAAIALVLMEANQYAKIAGPILKERNKLTILEEVDFHPLVKEEALKINERFKASLPRFISQK